MYVKNNHALIRPNSSSSSVISNPYNIPNHSNLSTVKSNQSITNQQIHQSPQHNYYESLRNYAQRLRQQKDTSLQYLKRINLMGQEIRCKDAQIFKLNKINKQLQEKLNVYESVLARSRGPRLSSGLRMSSILDKGNMMESIIQIVQDNKCQPKVVHSQLFEQFFILNRNLSNHASTQNDNNPYNYQFIFQNNNNHMEESIKLHLNRQEFVQPYNINQVRKKTQIILFLADSPFTILKPQERPIVPIAQIINPSLYYFGFCIEQRDLKNINGKFLWISTIYGFITFYPFAEYFLKLADNISKQFISNHQLLRQSLMNFQLSGENILCHNMCLDNPTQLSYQMFSKTQMLIIPRMDDIDIITTNFSKDLLKHYSMELIVDVLMLLLLQIPIAVVSQDQQVLSRFMFYFVCIIKPLKYPFPIVFCLPEVIQTLLQSPFPTFVGCKNYSVVMKYKCERAIFDLDQKVARSWPILNHLQASRICLMDMCKKGKNLIQEIINGKQKGIEPFCKDFFNTQIYQIYKNQQ